MTGESPRDEITEWLIAWRGGDDEALEKLSEEIYPHLRRIAAGQLRGERPDHTLQTAGLVNEAFLRLVRQERVEWRDRAHFFAVAARLMRRILIDHARRRQYAKRGGHLILLPLEDSQVDAAAALGPRETDLIALDEALLQLSEIDPESAQLVELRYFGGLTQEEIAEAMGIGPATVTRRWRSARAWLFRYLEKGMRSGR